MGVFVGSGEARLPAPSPHSHECCLQHRVRVRVPVGPRPMFQSGCLVLRAARLTALGTLVVGPRSQAPADRRRCGLGDSPLKPSSPGRNKEAAPRRGSLFSASRWTTLARSSWRIRGDDGTEEKTTWLGVGRPGCGAPVMVAHGVLGLQDSPVYHTVKGDSGDTPGQFRWR